MLAWQQLPHAIRKTFTALALLIPISALLGCGQGGCFNSVSCFQRAVLSTSVVGAAEFGTRSFGSSSSISVLLTNSGRGAASGLNALSIASPFSFAGGSFPGTGGTCGATLAARSSCTLTFNFTPVPPVSTVSQTAVLSFFDGKRTQTLSISLKGSGDNGTYLSPQGLGGAGVSIVAASSNRIYLGGSFTSYNSSAVGGIVALDSNFAIDSSFSTGTGFNSFGPSAFAFASDGSGDIYVGGQFTSFNGVSGINNIVRLNSDGSRDVAFATGTGFNDFVRCIVPALDVSGDVYVGGQFASYNGTAGINNIIRINSDGTRDPGFAAGTGFNSPVFSIAAVSDGSGDIYVSGGFNSYNGIPNVNRIVRLNSDGSLDTGFDIGVGASAGFDSTVSSVSLATDGSGDIYTGGYFITYKGSAVGRGIARLNNDGSLDTAFVTGTGFTFSVDSVAATPDGSGDVYVGGQFSTYNGASGINRITRLNGDGSIDPGFAVGTGIGDGFYPLITVATDGSGDLYAYSGFTLFNGTVVNNGFIKLKSNGTLDGKLPNGTGFNDFAWTAAAAADGSGDIYYGGNFTGFTEVYPTNRIARVNSDGSYDASFATGSGFDNFVLSVAPATDGSGKIYVGGFFTSYNGTSGINNITRLNGNGTLDSSFGVGAGFDSIVYSVVAASDGSGDVYIGGGFTAFNSVSGVNRIARLNSDGTRDLSFNTGVGFDNTVYSIALANDGSGDVFVGGNFTSYNGTSGIGRIVRLNSDGTQDVGFSTGTGFSVDVRGIAPAVDGSGDLYVGGTFTSFNGTAGINNIVRLNADGSRDSSFATGLGFDTTVYAINPAIDGSGDVYVGGLFTSFNGTSGQNKVARLNSDGSLDVAFATGTGFLGGTLGGIVTAIFPANDGSGDIYMSGTFTTFNGRAQRRGTRLNTLGVAD